MKKKKVLLIGNGINRNLLENSPGDIKNNYSWEGILNSLYKSGNYICAILQEKNKGATIIFDDSVFMHKNIKKFTYTVDNYDKVILEVLLWVKKYKKEFEKNQNKNINSKRR